MDMVPFHSILFVCFNYIIHFVVVLICSLLQAFVLQATVKKLFTALFIYNIPSLQMLFIRVGKFEYSTILNDQIKPNQQHLCNLV